MRFWRNTRQILSQNLHQSWIFAHPGSSFSQNLLQDVWVLFYENLGIILTNLEVDFSKYSMNTWFRKRFWNYTKHTYMLHLLIFIIFHLLYLLIFVRFRANIYALKKWPATRNYFCYLARGSKRLGMFVQNLNTTMHTFHPLGTGIHGIF